MIFKHFKKKLFFFSIAHFLNKTEARMIKNKDKEKIKKIDICHPDIKIMYILVSIRISTWPE